MKTIKIIDLLNKIANGEEVPTIEYDGMRTICYYLYDKCGEQCDDRELKNILNYEVEIIEEKKIPEKIKDKYNSQISKIELAQKFNQLIDYLKSKEKGE